MNEQLQRLRRQVEQLVQERHAAVARASDIRAWEREELRKHSVRLRIENAEKYAELARWEQEAERLRASTDELHARAVELSLIQSGRSRAVA